MASKFRLAGLLLAAIALTTTGLSIEYLRGTTEWNIAEINGITIGSFDVPFGPGPFISFDDYYYWIFKSYDQNANAGTVKGVPINKAYIMWSGTWKEIECNTIYCEMTYRGDDSWYMTFINPKYFVAYKKQDDYYPLYRLGKAVGEPY